MTQTFNNQVMFGHREWSILADNNTPLPVGPDNKPLIDKPLIKETDKREPSEVDKNIEEDSGIVGYMGDDEDIEQAKYDVMSLITDKIGGLDTQLERMNQELALLIGKNKDNINELRSEFVSEECTPFLISKCDDEQTYEGCTACANYWRDKRQLPENCNETGIHNHCSYKNTYIHQSSPGATVVISSPGAEKDSIYGSDDPKKCQYLGHFDCQEIIQNNSQKYQKNRENICLWEDYDYLNTGKSSPNQNEEWLQTKCRNMCDTYPPGECPVTNKTCESLNGRCMETICENRLGQSNCLAGGTINNINQACGYDKRAASPPDGDDSIFGEWAIWFGIKDNPNQSSACTKIKLGTTKDLENAPNYLNSKQYCESNMECGQGSCDYNEENIGRYNSPFNNSTQAIPGVAGRHPSGILGRKNISYKYEGNTFISENENILPNCRTAKNIERDRYAASPITNILNCSLYEYGRTSPEGEEEDQYNPCPGGADVFPSQGNDIYSNAVSAQSMDQGCNDKNLDILNVSNSFSADLGTPALLCEKEYESGDTVPAADSENDKDNCYLGRDITRNSSTATIKNNRNNKSTCNTYSPASAPIDCRILDMTSQHCKDNCYSNTKTDKCYPNSCEKLDPNLSEDGAKCRLDIEESIIEKRTNFFKDGYTGVSTYCVPSKSGSKCIFNEEISQDLINAQDSKNQNNGVPDTWSWKNIGAIIVTVIIWIVFVISVYKKYEDYIIVAVCFAFAFTCGLMYIILTPEDSINETRIKNACQSEEKDIQSISNTMDACYQGNSGFLPKYGAVLLYIALPPALILLLMISLKKPVKSGIEKDSMVLFVLYLCVSVTTSLGLINYFKVGYGPWKKKNFKIFELEKNLMPDLFDKNVNISTIYPCEKYKPTNNTPIREKAFRKLYGDVENTDIYKYVMESRGGYWSVILFIFIGYIIPVALTGAARVYMIGDEDPPVIFYLVTLLLCTLWPIMFYLTWVGLRWSDVFKYTSTPLFDSKEVAGDSYEIEEIYGESSGAVDDDQHGFALVDGETLNKQKGKCKNLGEFCVTDSYNLDTETNYGKHNGNNTVCIPQNTWESYVDLITDSVASPGWGDVRTWKYNDLDEYKAFLKKQTMLNSYINYIETHQNNRESEEIELKVEYFDNKPSINHWGYHVIMIVIYIIFAVIGGNFINDGGEGGVKELPIILFLSLLIVCGGSLYLWIAGNNVGEQICTNRYSLLNGEPYHYYENMNCDQDSICIVKDEEERDNIFEIKLPGGQTIEADKYECDKFNGCLIGEFNSDSEDKIIKECSGKGFNTEDYSKIKTIVQRTEGNCQVQSYNSGDSSANTIKTNAIKLFRLQKGLPGTWHDLEAGGADIDGKVAIISLWEIILLNFLFLAALLYLYGWWVGACVIPLLIYPLVYLYWMHSFNKKIKKYNKYTKSEINFLDNPVSNLPTMTLESQPEEGNDNSIKDIPLSPFWLPILIIILLPLCYKFVTGEGGADDAANPGGSTSSDD